MTIVGVAGLPDVASRGRVRAGPGAGPGARTARHRGGGSGPAAVAGRVMTVRGAVLAIVAEQTGYPADMLDLDLDLEADLGIDTVKQAETFAAIREAYGIERDDTLALRDYPTLRHVVGFVRDRAPGLPAAAPARRLRSRGRSRRVG